MLPRAVGSPIEPEGTHVNLGPGKCSQTVEGRAPSTGRGNCSVFDVETGVGGEKLKEKGESDRI